MGSGPSKASKLEAARSKNIDEHVKQHIHQEKRKLKILLLGTGDSGKSTLFKQLRTLYGDGYSDADRGRFALLISDNTICSMQALIRAAEIVGDKISPDLDKSVAAVQQTDVEARLTPDVGAHIHKLWGDPAIRRMFERRTEFHISESCNYFFDKVLAISEPTYVPDNMDALRIRAPTTGIVQTEFCIDQTVFGLLDVGGQRNERKKWIHCFEGVTSVIFVASLSEYDQVMYEDAQKNRLMEALELFDEICNSQWFVRSSMILFLNKSDLFRKKLPTKPLNALFPDYTGGNDFEAATEFIAQKFLDKRRNPDMKIYYFVTCATDSTAISRVFYSVRDTIIRRNMASFI